MDSRFPTFRRLIDGEGQSPSWWPWYTSAAQQQSLLRLIAVAVEEGLPLIDLLESWAIDERGIQRSRIRRLIRSLKRGRSLPDAIEEVPGILRDEDALALRFDSQSGTRTAAVREMLTEQRTSQLSAAPHVRRPIVYFCVVLPLGIMLVLFVQIRIMPIMFRLFSDFGLASPPVWRLSARFGNWLTNGGWFLALLVFVAFSFTFLTRPGRSFRQRLFGRLIRPLRQMYVADVLQKIAIAGRAGRPVPGALSTLARYHFDPAIRQELLFVRNEVEQGADIWQSMTKVGMLTSEEVDALRTSDRIGNRPWILQQLAEVKKRRSNRRFRRWSEMVLPALVLAMATLVLFQALSVFQPLTQMIEGLLM
jgi:type II secretory pathway component PulF